MKKIKKIIFGAILFSLICSVFISCDSKQDFTFEQALEVYNSGDRDEAKKMFEKLSANGDFNADFWLAYGYKNDYETKYKYYRNAAINGHKDAMENFLDLTVYRVASYSLTGANPKDALFVYEKYLENADVYEKAKKEKLEFLKKIADVPEFNVIEFLKKYNIEYDEKNFAPYFLWELAEEASKEGSRFGEPDPELIFQLIVYGGDVPAEFSFAVNKFYEYYKNNEVHEFKIEDFVTSGYGMNYLSARSQNEKEKQHKMQIDNIAERISEENKQLFYDVMDSFYEYVGTKIYSEECNEGSGYITWALQSGNAQIEELINLFDSLLTKKYFDFSDLQCVYNDNLAAELEKIKTKRDEILVEDSISGVHFTITLDEELEIDALWERYCKNIIEFTQKEFGSEISKNMEDWVYKNRINNLLYVLEAANDYRKI